MEKFRFLKWNVYFDAQELFGFLLKIVKRIPKEYRFELGSQIVRSSFSVILNIAEGSGKGTDRDFSKYIDISLGSLYEVLAATDTLKRNDLMSRNEFDKVFEMCDKISSQLGGLKKKLKSCK